MIVLFVMCIQSAFIAQEKRITIPDLLKQFPAQSTEERDRLARAIVQSGSEGIIELCRMLVPSGKGDDAQARYALNGLAHYISSPAGTEDERRIVEKVYTDALKASVDAEVKAFLIEQLQLLGHDDSVKPLSHFLMDDRLCDPAAQALVSIGSSKAEKALLETLKKSEGKRRIALIKALGELGSRRAVKTITGYTKNQDVDLRQISLWALANIGDPSSEKILAEMLKTASPGEYTKAASFYLLFVERLAQSGKPEACVRICREFLRDRMDEEDQVRCAALSLLVSVLGEEAFPDLYAAVDSDSNALRGVALKLAETLGGASTTEEWIGKLRHVPIETEAMIVRMLGRRGDRTALPAILEEINGKDPIVRIAAIQSAGRVGKNGAIPAIIEAMKTADKETLEAVKESLLSYSDEEGISLLARVLPEMPPLSRVTAMEVLAERGARQFREVVYGQTKTSDSNVRLAALRALETLADAEDLPRLIGFLKKTDDPAELRAVENAVVASAQSLSPPEERSTLLLTEYPSMMEIQRHAVLRALSRIGGKKALRRVVEETGSPEVELRHAAVRALAEWPDMSASNDLLKISRTSKDDGDRKLALRGYVRLVDESALLPWEKLYLLKAALDDRDYIDEIRLVLRGLAEVHNVASLKVVSEYFHDEMLKHDAASAAMAIAFQRSISEEGLVGEEVVSILNDVLAVLEDEPAQRRVREYIDRISSGGESSGKIELNRLPEEYYTLFNGADLTGWRRHDNLPGHGLAGKWFVEEETIVGTQDPPGYGGFLTTTTTYQDFELLLETKIDWPFDSGVFLRVGPDGKCHQITLDYRSDGEIGGVYCSWTQGFVYHCPEGVSYFKKDAWNRMRIVCQGEPARIRVWLNGTLITDFQHTAETTAGVPKEGTIALQVHPGGEGFEESRARFRNIFIREIPREGEWKILFNGSNFTGWTGATTGYLVQDGKIVCPENGGGNLYTKEEFSDFILRFQFKLTPGANNGLGIRAPLTGDAAYVGMELQILDNTAEKYRDLKPYQFHGSIYGVVPAKREYLRPTGEWNFEEVIAKGRRIKVNLNGVTIVDADIDEASRGGTMDGRDHPGLKREKGHIGFLGHGSCVEFRGIQIKELNYK